MVVTASLELFINSVYLLLVYWFTVEPVALAYALLGSCDSYAGGSLSLAKLGVPGLCGQLQILVLRNLLPLLRAKKPKREILWRER